MNTYNITLSSNSQSGTRYYDEIDLFDNTLFNFNLVDVKKDSLLRSVCVDWGDGSDVFIPEISILKDYRNDSIIPEILYGPLSPIFTDTFTHEYTPSSTSLYKQLTSTIRIEYITGNAFTFYIPFRIKTSNYYQSVGDLRLIDTTIYNEEQNSSNFVFVSEKTNHVVELNNTTN